MSRSVAIMFCIVGYGWAIIGLWNIIGYVVIRNPSSGAISFSLIFNMLLFIWPGLSIGSKGSEALSKLNRQTSVNEDA